MKISEKHWEILNFLADESDKDQSVRFNDLNIRVLAVKVVREYLGEHVQTDTTILVEELEQMKLVSFNSKTRNVVITEKGYRLVRPSHRKAFDAFKSHFRFVMIYFVLPVLAIVVGYVILRSLGIL